VGWFWFLGTLVPVIGLVQVGNKSMADRYSYIPSIGLLILIVWGAGALIRTRRVKVWLAVASGLLVIAVWSAVSAVQVGVWRNSETLFSHALRVSPAPKGIVHYNLGLALADAGDYAGAFPHFAAALEANPNLPRAHNNIGVYHARRGNLEAAAGHFREAVRMKPGYAAALDNLRLAEKLLGKRDRP
jgi:tetratricopeptide (TPR) repeat protein